ncbi:MAG: 4'-phosphopantetheinyl transferase superfamily protein [Pseudomonadota bacterium]
MNKAIDAALREMLGPDCGIGVTNPQLPPGNLSPQEAKAIARAVPKRRREFYWGRVAAHQAMADHGLAPVAIPAGQDRAPIWPDGISGSIAHSDTVCIAAVTKTRLIAQLGLDVEPATPLEANLVDTVCTAQECAWLQAQQNSGIIAKQIFSAKEAVYKAQYAFTGTVIDFQDVNLVVNLETGQFHPDFVRKDLMVPAMIGESRLTQGQILSICRSRPH